MDQDLFLKSHVMLGALHAIMFLKDHLVENHWKDLD